MLSSLLAVAAGAGMLAQSGAIIAATLIVEDAATVVVAIMSADGSIPVGAALGSLYAGIALGDFGLYGLGKFASRYQWARRLVPADTYGSVQHWLRQNLISAVVTTRFLPGLRLPAYTACGFLHMPLGRFTAAVIVGTIVWTSLLFSVSYALGTWAADQIGVWRWPAGLVLAVIFILASRAVVHRRVLPGRAL